MPLAISDDDSDAGPSTRDAKRKAIEISSSSSEASSSASKYQTGEDGEGLVEDKEAGLTSASGRKGKGKERAGTSQSEDRVARGKSKSKEKGMEKRKGGDSRNKKARRWSSSHDDSSESEEDRDPRMRRRTRSSTKGRKKRSLALSSSSSSSSSSRAASPSSSASSATFFGRLHDSDSEPDLGSWTRKDQKQIAVSREGPEEKDEDGNPVHEVSGILRWRRHPRRMYPQYRAAWKGWGLWDNTWEHGDCFNLTGENRSDPKDVINRFWQDLEREGLQQRPSDWDEMEEHSLHSSDTCEMLASEDPKTYKEGWRRARRDFRRDKKAQRQMSRRKELWRQSDEKEKEDAKEELRQKRRKEKAFKDELAARATVSTATSSKVPITIKATPVNGHRPLTSRSDAALPVSAIGPAHSSSTAKKLSGTMTQPKSNASRSMPSLQDAAKFLPSPATARRGGTAGGRGRGGYVGQHRQPPKVKVFDPLASFPKPSHSTAPRPQPLASNVTSATQQPLSAKVPSGEEGPARWTSSVSRIENRSLAVPSTGPRSIAQVLPPPTMSAHAPPTTTVVPVPSSGSNFVTPISAPDSTNDPAFRRQLQSPPPPSDHMNPRPQQAAPSQVLRMGIDPRRRVNGPQEPAPRSTNPVSGTSLVHLAQETTVEPPRHNHNPSIRLPHDPAPQEPGLTRSSMSPTIGGPKSPPPGPARAPVGAGDSARLSERNPASSSNGAALGSGSEVVNELSRGDKRAAEAALRDWNITEEAKDFFRPRYNVVHKDEKKLLKVLLFCGATFKLEIEPKLFEPTKNVIFWVRDLGMPLSIKEGEALQRPNFVFWTYGTTAGVKEVWPLHTGGILMYTFGALLHRLVDQCHFHRDQPEEAGRVLLHPVQKLFFEQLVHTAKGPSALIDVLEALKLVDPSQSAAAAISLVEGGLLAIETIEEVDLREIESPISTIVDLEEQLQSGTSSSARIVELFKEVDVETRDVLRKLQVHLATRKRTFTLIMESTQLTEAEVGTCTRVIKKPRYRSAA